MKCSSTKYTPEVHGSAVSIAVAKTLRVPNIHPCWSSSLGRLLGAGVPRKLLDDCKQTFSLQLRADIATAQHRRRDPTQRYNVQTARSARAITEEPGNRIFVELSNDVRWA
jgi:hypothetical protein